MKHLILIILMAFSFLFSSQILAQKIKTKKGITYIDNVPYLKITGVTGIENSQAKFTHYKTDKLFLVFTYKTYKVDSDTHWYLEVRFADVDLSFNTNNQYIKALVKGLYENKVLTEEGTFKTEDLEKYIRLYGFSIPTKDN